MTKRKSKATAKAKDECDLIEVTTVTVRREDDYEIIVKRPVDEEVASWEIAQGDSDTIYLPDVEAIRALIRGLTKLVELCGMDKA